MNRFLLTKKPKLHFVLVFLLATSCFLSFFNWQTAYAMPFYDLKPQALVLRASFYTTYLQSSNERKNNIYMASKYLNNTLVDVGGEFSFNRTVGDRTEKRGFMQAKIIVNGEFVDGIGGGVCQVSSTLYNAVILAGLEVTEYHPHSLPVNYVAPSFDAMVNSGWADLRFVNNTHNPIIIKTSADGQKITVNIYGEKLTKKYQRLSIIKETLPIPEAKVLYDEKGEYPDIFEGEFKIVRYGKEGYRSEGYLIVSDEKGSYKQKIRNDKYNATRGLIVWGTSVKEEQCE